MSAFCFDFIATEISYWEFISGFGSTYSSCWVCSAFGMCYLAHFYNKCARTVHFWKETDWVKMFCSWYCAVIQLKPIPGEWRFCNKIIRQWIQLDTPNPTHQSWINPVKTGFAVWVNLAEPSVIWKSVIDYVPAYVGERAVWF